MCLPWHPWRIRAGSPRRNAILTLVARRQHVGNKSQASDKRPSLNHCLSWVLYRLRKGYVYIYIYCLFIYLLIYLFFSTFQLKPVSFLFLHRAPKHCLMFDGFSHTVQGAPFHIFQRFSYTVRPIIVYCGFLNVLSKPCASIFCTPRAFCSNFTSTFFTVLRDGPKSLHVPTKKPQNVLIETYVYIYIHILFPRKRMTNTPAT